jgi:hypothetical protein
MAEHTSGNYNTALGVKTLSKNTSGSSNVAIGTSAMLNNSTTSDNTVIGFNALSASTSNGQLTAVGSGAMEYAIGAQNTALGYQALRGASGTNVGNYNTALGWSTLSVNTSGGYNTAIGNQAMQFNTGGVHNTALGHGALYNNPNGSSNIAIGKDAGQTITGSNNTIIGASAAVSVYTGSNNIVIGYQANPSALSTSNETTIGTTTVGMIRVTAANASISSTNIALNNTTVTGGLNVTGTTTLAATTLAFINNNLNVEIGSSSTFDAALIDFHSNDSVAATDYDTRIISYGGTAGSNGQGRIEIEAKTTIFTSIIESTSTNTGSLQVRGGLGVSGNVYARAYYATSDSRVKTNVTNINIQSLDVLRKIQPRKYDHIDTQSNEPTYGFVAQEIKKILPNAVSFRSDYIPSVYEMAFIDNLTITLINKSTTDISMCDIKLLDNKRNEIISRVIEISNDKTFIIDKPISDFLTYKTDVSGNILTFTIHQGKMIYMRGSEEYTGLVKKCIFVYGHYINDFHVVNKDTIWTVLLSSTQEMDAQLQLANSNIAKQDIRIADLEQTVRRQQADIDAIKLRLG